MTITCRQEGTELTVAVAGRLNTVTVSEFEDNVMSCPLNSISGLTLDFKKLDYISSAGLHSLIRILKQMKSKDAMKIIHANPMVRETLEITGFGEYIRID